MALAVLYSPEFVDNLEAILTYYDERNGSDTYSKKLFKMLHEHARVCIGTTITGWITI